MVLPGVYTLSVTQVFMQTVNYNREWCKEVYGPMSMRVYNREAE